jgi:uncharacterized membrane protein SpoIIM required for sporulation
MELDRFIRERRPRWDRLERLLGQAENAPERAFAPESIQELVRLYRQACSDLNQARSITADPALLERLNLLTGKGYRYVYRDTRRTTLWEAIRKLFVHEVPSAFRAERPAISVAAGAMILGALFGWVAVRSNPERVWDLVPDLFKTESPKERVEKIERESERIDTLAKAATFSAQLFTHNIQVSFLAFSLGALTIAGGFLILFYNGIILGAIAAQYSQEGVSTFFIAWVGPHGSLELPAIIFSGAAGMIAGRALLLPGNLSRAAAVRLALPTVRRMLLAAASILVLAGLIEGSFSQFSQKTFSYGLKIAVAILLFGFMMAYLFLPRRSAPGGGT